MPKREGSNTADRKNPGTTAARPRPGCVQPGNSLCQLTPLQQLLQAAVEVLGAGRLQPHVCRSRGCQRQGAEGAHAWGMSLAAQISGTPRKGIKPRAPHGPAHPRGHKPRASACPPPLGLTHGLQLAVEREANLGLHSSRQLSDAGVDGSKQLAADGRCSQQRHCRGEKRIMCVQVELCCLGASSQRRRMTPA